MDIFSFKGKHVLVTGASGGLGSALVHELARMRSVLIISSRSEKALKELIASLPQNTQVIAITADLSKAGESEKLAIKAIKELGHIDVLFNNAGIGYFSLMEEATEINIRHLFEVNAFSPLFLIQALLPQMKKMGRGRVINIISSGFRVPIPTVGVYNGSKSSLSAMTNTMRLELAPSGIEIINIYPGTIDNSFEENAIHEDDRPGLCPSDHCGLPKFDIAKRILKAASGPSGEVWLEREGKWYSAFSIIFQKLIDSRLSPLRDKVLENKIKKKRRWRLLQVESSIACNLQCVMCPWKGISKEFENQGIMYQEIWESIRPHLKNVTSVDFTGGGEPLLQPKLVDWVGEAKAAGCEVGFLTNGMLLKTETTRKLIKKGIDWICVSIDAATADLYEKIRKGANFSKVCENVAGIAKIRFGKIPKTMINFVMMENNFHQVEDMIKLAEELGVDQVNFKQCDVIRAENGKGLGLFASKETKQIREMEKKLSKARRLAKKRNILTTAFLFTPRERPVCDQDPRDTLFIRHDGAVSSCINLAIGGPTTFLGDPVSMPTVHWGRLCDQDLLEIWEVDTCKSYQTSFENRVNKYEDSMVKSLTSGSSTGPEKARLAAQNAMPDPPAGCNICHYLYDI